MYRILDTYECSMLQLLHEFVVLLEAQPRAKPQTSVLSIGYWIHKSALCAHILHEFVVLLEAKPSAKPQTSAIYGA